MAIAAPYNHEALPVFDQLDQVEDLTDFNYDVLGEETLSSDASAYRDIAPRHHLYMPEGGSLVQTEEREIGGGTLKIGLYTSKRASHRVGLYIPEDYDRFSPLPKIVMSGAHLTGVKGHNEATALEMMAAGYVVIVKGVPRYHRPTSEALTLAEDANEMLGLVQEVSKTNVIEPIDQLLIYGESQAAMKGLAVLGVAKDYGLEVVNGLLVAPCYMEQIDWNKPFKQLGNLASSATSALRFMRQASWEDIKRLQGTLSIKDLHHHLIVIPRLVSGEPGTFLPHINRQQLLTVSLFGKDAYSDPHETQRRLRIDFPKMHVEVDNKHGHIDGILSHETRVLRGVVLFEVAKIYGVEVSSV